MQIYAYPQGRNWATDCKKLRSNDMDKIQEFIESNIESNIYFNCCLMEDSESGRGGSNNAAVMPALFADFDTADGVHKGNRATRQDIGAMLQSGEVVPMPSVVVDSGGGVHAYWFFDKPIEIDTEEDRQLAKALLEGINERLKEWHQENNFDYERLKDLARVLRVPGTYNQKTDPPKEVKPIWPKDDKPIVKFQIEDLTFVPDLGPVVESEFDAIVDIDEDRAIKIATQACLKIEPEWGDDASGYVIRCCRQCVRAGCTLGQTIKVIAAMDKIQGPLPKQWTDKEIEARYESAKEQSSLGENSEKSYKFDDFGFAERLSDSVNGRMIFIPKWKQTLAWNGKYFEADHGRRVREAICCVVEKMLNEPPSYLDDKELKAYIAHAQRYRSAKGLRDADTVLKTFIPVDHDSLNSRHDLFHCDNGVLHLGTQAEFREHSPEHLNTEVAGVVYDKSAKCPRWEQFIDEITNGDKDLADYMQKIVGYCLSGDVSYEALFVLYGEGENGKSIFTELLSRLLGHYSTPANKELLMGQKENTHPTQLAALHGKRAVIVQETSQDCKLNESQVKMITGGDRIEARRLYENGWEFQPTHKTFLSTNYLPTIHGQDHGIWRRIKIIPFNRRFSGAERDRDLKSKLTKELSGILNWAIRGYENLQLCGGWVEPDSVVNSKQEYRSSSDIFSQYLEDECEFHPDFKVKASDIYRSLEFYCMQHGHPRPWPSQRKIGLELKKKGMPGGRFDQSRGYFGLRLKTEFDD